MNYWFAEMTNMNLVTPLFDYIEVSETQIILSGTLSINRRHGLLEEPKQLRSCTIPAVDGSRMMKSVISTYLSSVWT